MELKPCDRCGGEITYRKEYFNDMECESCGLGSLKDYSTEAEAIAAWNHRPIEDELRGRIKELEEQVFALSTGTRESRALARIRELEQKLKEMEERAEYDHLTGDEL
jgi:hypothetical protein